MHEFSIATSLLQIITEEARPFKGARVRTVRLRIGTLSGILPDALRFAFEIITEGTVAEGAALVIEEVPMIVSCRACGKVSAPDDPFILCPGCGSGDADIKGGRELEIESMEIEDMEGEDQETCKGAAEP
jgi:hydrogenase nickel incorporation protein HypA/HybF